MRQVSNDIKGLVARYLSYWEKADTANLMSMFAEDVQYHDMTSGAIVRHEELEAFLQDTFARETDSNLEINNVIYPKEDSALIHWTQILRLKESMEAVQVGGVELLVFEHGKITSVHEFYDYRGIDAGRSELSADEEHYEQLSKLGLAEGDLEKIADAISAYFKTEKPYLDPKLNLAAIADALGYTRNQISYVINHRIGCSFYDFVNRHRVNHSIKRMEEAGPEFSVVKAAVEAGFNTISGFYNAFKKQTGATPSVYRKTAIDEPDSVRTRMDD